MSARAEIKAQSLTAERARELLHYDKKTGAFKWKKSSPGRVAGKSVGTISHGYRQIELDYKFFRAGRLAWLIVTGSWPECLIDHINGNRSDDRWTNLRAASYQENARNKTLCRRNKSGKVGVHKVKRNGLWGAEIGLNGRNIKLGHFRSKSDAIAVRLEAEKQYFGEFIRPVSAYNRPVKAGGR